MLKNRYFIVVHQFLWDLLLEDTLQLGFPLQRRYIELFLTIWLMFSVSCFRVSLIET